MGEHARSSPDAAANLASTPTTACRPKRASAEGRLRRPLVVLSGRSGSAADALAYTRPWAATSATARRLVVGCPPHVQRGEPRPSADPAGLAAGARRAAGVAGRVAALHGRVDLDAARDDADADGPPAGGRDQPLAAAVGQADVDLVSAAGAGRAISRPACCRGAGPSRPAGAAARSAARGTS
jgi:hypothetical protein